MNQRRAASEHEILEERVEVVTATPTLPPVPQALDEGGPALRTRVGVERNRV